MKKLICCCLALLLLLPWTAGAEDTAAMDVAGLMARQVSANSAFRTQITAEVSGPAPSFDSEGLWTLLGGVLPGLSLESAYVLSRAGETLGNSQLTLSLKREEQPLASLYVAGRGGHWQVWGDGLEESVLLLPRDTSLLLRNPYLTLSGWGNVLLRGAGYTESLLHPAQEGEWPPLRRFLAQAGTMDAAWLDSAEQALQAYTQQLSLWMQEHTQVQVQRNEAGAVYLETELRADAAALAEEALALLRRFYGDAPLLALLRQGMTRQEARAYLEPGMLMLFERVLGEMTLAEDFVLQRSYDTEGALERMVLTLPLPEGVLLRFTEAGPQKTLAAETPEAALEISVQGDAAQGWQGAFSLQRGEERLAGRYQLLALMEETAVDLSDDARARQQNGLVTLQIDPEEGQSFSAQSITVEITAYAGAQDAQPAHWNAAVTWREADTGATLRISIKTRTGAAIGQTEAAGETLDITQAEEAMRGAILQRLLSLWINAALARDAS